MGNKFTISYGSAAPATSKLLPYELGLDNVTNTLYIGKEGGTSVALNTADTVGAIKRAGDTVVNGHFVYYNTSPVATASLFYNGSPFELREAGDVGNTQSADVYSPSIGFHWKNVAGAAIVMPPDEKFYRINSAGNKYRIYDAQDVIPITGGGTGATDAAGARSAIGAAAASHDHSTSNITSGTLSVGRGGTGQTTLAAFRNSIGLGNSTSTLDIANGGTGATTAAGIRNAIGLGNTTGALPVANGGTGVTTAAGIRNAIGLGNTTGVLGYAYGGLNSNSLDQAKTNLGIASSSTTTPATTPSALGTITTFELYKTGKIVHFTMRCEKSFTTGLTEGIGVIPTAYRPAYATYAALSVYTSSNTVITQAYATGGDVSFRLSGAVSAVIISGSWVTT